MIKTVFTLANNIAKRFRYSPTAIIEGREQRHLQTRIDANEQYQLEREAAYQNFLAEQAATSCPFEKEKLKIAYDYSDQRKNFTFQEAWMKIDEVEQRESDQAWREFRSAK